MPPPIKVVLADGPERQKFSKMRVLRHPMASVKQSVETNVSDSIAGAGTNARIRAPSCEASSRHAQFRVPRFAKTVAEANSKETDNAILSLTEQPHLRSSSCEPVLSPSTRVSLGDVVFVVDQHAKNIPQDVPDTGTGTTCNPRALRLVRKLRAKRYTSSGQSTALALYPDSCETRDSMEEAGDAKTQQPRPPSESAKKSRATFQRKAKLAATVGAASKSEKESAVTPSPDVHQLRLKLKLTRLVKKSRSDTKFKLFTKQILSSVDSLRDAIALTRRSAEEALSKLKKIEDDTMDASLCSAASTEDERAANERTIAHDCFVGLKMSRFASRFGSHRRSPIAVATSCLVRGPSSGMSSSLYIGCWTPMSSSRRRARRIKKYLDDGDDKEKEEEHEPEATTPQVRTVQIPPSLQNASSPPPFFHVRNLSGYMFPGAFLGQLFAIFLLSSFLRVY